MLGSPECPAEQMAGKSEHVQSRTPGSTGATALLIDFSLRLPFWGFPPSFLFFLHCITLNRAAGVLPLVSSIKQHTNVPEKRQFIQEMPTRLGGRGWFLLCVVFLFFLSTVWLHVMSPITVIVPSLSRSRVMRFPNYCHLNERLGRRGFLLLI